MEYCSICKYKDTSTCDIINGCVLINDIINNMFMYCLNNNIHISRILINAITNELNN